MSAAQTNTADSKTVSSLEAIRAAFERRWPFAAECRAGDGYQGAMGLRWEGWIAAFNEQSMP